MFCSHEILPQMIHPLKIDRLIKKQWTREMNKQTLGKELQIAYNHKEKGLASFKIKEVQGKTMLREVKLMEK